MGGVTAAITFIWISIANLAGCLYSDWIPSPSDRSWGRKR